MLTRLYSWLPNPISSALDDVRAVARFNKLGGIAAAVTVNRQTVHHIYINYSPVKIIDYKSRPSIHYRNGK